MIEKGIMRDVFIETIYDNMKENENIFFITADFGSPQLDRIREEFKDRYINVGIAEQNLINVSFGLALEGFVVYAYAIIPFLTMRAFEQIRNIAINFQNIKKKTKDKININLLGVGAGLSYNISGPSHCALEDISIMRTLPGIEIISPSDCVLVKKSVDYSMRKKGVKYFRLDGKSLPIIYKNNIISDFDDGFCKIKNGQDGGTCLVSTGFMTHKAINVANNRKDVGVIDIFLLNFLNENLFYNEIKRYKQIITIEEGFIGKGGLDSLVSKILDLKGFENNIKLKRLGFQDYVFTVGDRDYLLELNGLDEDGIINMIKNDYHCKA